MRIDLIIDDLGAIWAPDSWDLHQKHRLIGTKSDLTGYLVRNCGHIRLNLAPALATARMTFRSGGVGTRAVQAALKILRAFAATRTTVELVGPCPLLLVLHGMEEVLAFVPYHCIEESTLKRPHFFREQRPLRSMLHDPKLAKLQSRYRLWRRARGVLAGATRDRTLFGPDSMEYLASFSGDIAKFREIGDGYTMLKSSLVNSLGKPINEQADARYGAWVATCLLKAEFYRRPILENVEADIELPDQPKTRARYQRLLLPWIVGGEVVVSCVSYTRATFAAR